MQKERKTHKDYFNVKLLNVIYLGIILITFFKVYPYVFDDKIDLNGDNIEYYIFGASIAQGDGFSDIRLPHNPPTSRFPPGYPVIISSVMKIFGKDIVTVKHANGFFLLISLVILFFLFRKIVINIHLAFVITILILLNAHLLKSSTIMMSEIPFLFFSVVAIYALIQLDYEKIIYKNIWFFLLVVSVVCAYYIRSAGLALVGGVMLVFLFRKKWIYAISFIAGFILLYIPWFFRGKAMGLGSAGNYMGILTYKNPYRRELGRMEFKDWFVRIYHNFERYVTHEIPNSCFSFFEVKYNDDVLLKEWIIGAIIIGLIIFGLFKLKSYREILFFYLLGNFGIMFLWPEVWYGTRFIIPIVPILLLLAIIGFYNLVLIMLTSLKIRSSFVLHTVLPLSFLILVTGFRSGVETLNMKSKGDYPANYKRYFELALWAKENLPDTSFVACRKSELFFIYSGKYSTGYPQTADQESLIERMKVSGIDYVVLDELGYSSTGRYLYPAIKKYPLKFKVVKRIEESGSYLFEFKPNLGYWGEWANDKREGQGTYSWENGTFYEGSWIAGQRDGEGKLILKDGTSYTGFWEKDKMNGKFIIRSKNGEIVREEMYRNNKRVN